MKELTLELVKDIKNQGTRRSIWCGVHMFTPTDDEKIWYDGRKRKITEVIKESDVFPVLLKWQNTVGEIKYAKVTKPIGLRDRANKR